MRHLEEHGHGSRACQSELTVGNRRHEDSLPDLFLEPIIVTDNFWNYDLNLKAARIVAWSLRVPGNKRRLPCILWQNPPDTLHWDSLSQLMWVAFLVSALSILQTDLSTGRVGMQKSLMQANSRRWDFCRQESWSFGGTLGVFPPIISPWAYQEGCTSLHSLEQGTVSVGPCPCCLRFFAGVIGEQAGVCRNVTLSPG